jgi:general stress protein 26
LEAAVERSKGMSEYEKSLQVLDELFGRDYQFALATSKENVPSVRFVDMFYSEGAFYVVTYGKSAKVIDIEQNEKISMCNKLYRFYGVAHNIGHPLKEENLKIREKLIKVFEPWYFLHNNEEDENMCYVKITPDQGFFYKDGTGYRVDFNNQTVESFPFIYGITVID